MSFGAERKPHQLSPTQRKSKPELCIYFDTESNVGLNQEHTPYLLCATFIRYRKSKAKVPKPNRPLNKVYATRDYDTEPIVPNFWKGVDITKYNPIRQFWEDVDQFALSGKRLTIYAHNVGYDINAVHAIDNLVKLGYKLTSVFDKGSYIMTMEKRFDAKHKKTITFINTGNYFKGTLKTLAKTFGIPPKLEIDFKVMTFLESVPYCQRDVLICQKAMEGFRDFLEKYDLGTMKSTIASQAFSTFCYKFLPAETLYIHTHAEATRLERLSYHGGRTENFKVGSFQGTHYKEDVNSMYPSVMANEKFPTKLVSYWKSGTVSKIQDIINQGFGVVATVKVNESITTPHTPYQDTDKLIFPGGTFTVTLCTPELIPLLAAGKVLEVFHVAVYKMGYIFKNYVTYFYDRRNEAKAAHDDMLSNMWKLFLNALYGKFGQKADNWSIIDTCAEGIFEIVEEFNANSNTWQTVKKLGGTVFKHEETTEAFNAFTAIASHVTSYARAKLARCMDVVGRENLFYCDTDSLFVNKSGHDRLNDAGELDDHLLGKMKLEDSYTGTLILHGAKDYVWNNKPTLKGIGKNDKQIDEETYLCSQWPKLARLLQKGPYKKYATITIIKHLSRRCNSGTRQPNGDIQPYILKEGIKIA